MGFHNRIIKFARHLAGTGWRFVVKSAAVGIPLPLCSCGVLPAAISMRRNGASRAASTSFLVATPQTGLDSIAATWSLLGPAFAVIGSKPLLSMVTVLVIAIPMYVCATGSIPIALSLMIKGLSPGTALVLLMAGPAANFASFTLISREMGRKSAIIYLASIVVGAMTFGLIIDYVLPDGWFTLGNAQAMAGKEHALSLLSTASSAVLVILLVVTFIKGHKHNHITVSAMTKEYTIKGMSCTHCQATVAKSISSVKGVKQVDVNLSTGIATVEGEHNAKDVESAVRNAGFDVVS